MFSFILLFLFFIFIHFFLLIIYGLYVLLFPCDKSLTKFTGSITFSIKTPPITFSMSLKASYHSLTYPLSKNSHGQIPFSTVRQQYYNRFSSFSGLSASFFAAYKAARRTLRTKRLLLPPSSLQVIYASSSLTAIISS